MGEKAARAYDLAALKYWGPSTHLNYPVPSVTPSSLTFTNNEFFVLFYESVLGFDPVRVLSVRDGRHEEDDPASVRCSLEKVLSLSLYFVCISSIFFYLSLSPSMYLSISLSNWAKDAGRAAGSRGVHRCTGESRGKRRSYL